MIDPQLLREQLDTVIERLSTRGFIFDQEHYLTLESRRKSLQKDTEALQNIRNERSKIIGILKSQGKPVEALLVEMKAVGNELTQKEEALSEVQETLRNFLLTLPNLPHATVPVGHSDADNVCVKMWGEPRQFDFTPKDHVDLGESLQQMDFEAATRLSGARFVVLKKGLARLHRVLIQFMIDHHIRHGYEEVYVPYLNKAESLYGTGQLPKMADDLFAIEELDLFLIPTAEVPVTNLFRDQIVEAEELPKWFVAHTPCFRKEAGSYGKDTRGMIRQHQFEKVELVQAAHPAESEKALEQLTHHAESILQALELPYRVMALCTGDLGFASLKTYDLEVWLPGQNCYREISSCSLFGDFQARRLQARFRSPDQSKPQWIHTLNGSALAVGRTLVAILENYQTVEGNIQIPTVLQPYWEGMTLLPG